MIGRSSAVGNHANDFDPSFTNVSEKDNHMGYPSFQSLIEWALPGVRCALLFGIGLGVCGDAFAQGNKSVADSNAVDWFGTKSGWIEDEVTRGWLGDIGARHPRSLRRRGRGISRARHGCELEEHGSYERFVPAY
jgi:hypothetical protein